MQRVTDSNARDTGGFPRPQITTSAVTNMKMLQFHATNQRDCGSGLGPIAFMPMGAMSAKAKLQLAKDIDNASIYINQKDSDTGKINQQDSDTGKVTAANVKDLAKACGYPVTSWSECDMQLRQYYPFLCMIHAMEHKACAAYLQGLQIYESIKLQLQAAMNELVGPALAPALLIYHFHLIVLAWF